jgi:hypothetical protein
MADNYQQILSDIEDRQQFQKIDRIVQFPFSQLVSQAFNMPSSGYAIAMLKLFDRLLKRKQKKRLQGRRLGRRKMLDVFERWRQGPVWRR